MQEITTANDGTQILVTGPGSFATSALIIDSEGGRFAYDSTTSAKSDFFALTGVEA